MIHRFLLCTVLFTLVASAQPTELNAGSNPISNHDRSALSWDWNYDTEEGGGSSYLGVDIADVSPERLGELKLKEEHGAEITMVDQDAPAGKAGLHEHDVIVSLNGTAVESAAQLRRMIRETPPGRVVNLGISRDGQPLTIKVQLADRHKSTGWGQNGKFEMPQMPKMPDLPDFDLPVSVVVVHSSMRSGLMVENITSQLGEFFGVKGGKGVLVRSVEKGSRGEKAGFRAGDVVVKVNNQPVHDTSDFTHALRSSSGSAASVTVMREKKEQTLTLTLPEKKDSGSLLEDSFDIPEFTEETEQAINRAQQEVARVTPAILQKVQQALRSRNMDLKDLDKKLQDLQQKMQERQQEMR
ncbi:MAG TPA: PDZ domain-containing protein, partial [Candidatus Acidoferrales bacterium]|nr:PDZ domain-containing protein [Candidatus Acidoferrales bacterium]